MRVSSTPPILSVIIKELIISKATGKNYCQRLSRIRY